MSHITPLSCTDGEKRWYEDGWKAFHAGIGPYCPIPFDDNLEMRLWRRRWFDGWYDARLSQKFPWWLDKSWRGACRFTT